MQASGVLNPFGGAKKSAPCSALFLFRIKSLFRKTRIGFHHRPAIVAGTQLFASVKFFKML